MPFQSQRSSLRSRVTPGRLVHDRGTRLRQPVDEGRLADVREADDRDRPGDPDRFAARSLERSPLIHDWSRVARRRRDPGGRPSRCIVHQPVQEPPDLRLHQHAMPPCSPCRPSGGRRTSSARPTRSRRAGSSPAATSASRGSRPGRSGRPPGAPPSPLPAGPRPGRPSAAACPRRTARAPCPSATMLPHRAHRLAIRLAAADGEAAEGADERPETRDAMRLDLRHVVEDAWARGAEDDGSSQLKWFDATTIPPSSGTRSLP